MGERITVILGAGASWDVDTGSTPRTNPEWHPPLVSNLFEGRETFYDVRRYYRGAARLGQVLHPRAAAGALDMEQELRSLAESDDPVTRRDFLDIPPYLRDVMYQVGIEAKYLGGNPVGYVVSPGAYALLLHELLVAAGAEVMFVVMNYDTLLERALWEYDAATYTFNSFEGYIRPERQAKVVKPHGSVDWWAPLRPAVSSQTWFEALDLVSLEQIRELAKDRHYIRDITSSFNAKLEINGQPHWMYPLITAPLSNKTELDLVCPQEQLDCLASFLTDCQRYLFIGTSGFDADILSFMADHMPDSSVAEFVFGGNENKHRIAHNDARDRIIKALPSLKGQPVPDKKNSTVGDTFVDGFASYLLTRRARTLALNDVQITQTEFHKELRN
jgi:hypothetical protein